MTFLPGSVRLMACAAAMAMVAGAASAESLRWARTGDALTLDPHAANEGPTSAVLNQIYETLVERAMDGSLEPRLATSWHVHPDDPSVWEFTLREGVTFHDGTPFTAEDVVFSLNRARAETSDFRGLHASVADVTAIDDMTVHVQMVGPSPLWVQNVTGTFMVSRAWAEANGVTEPQNFAAGEENFAVRNTNGTGPYVLVERDPEVRTVLRLNPEHWSDTTPQVTEIIFLPIVEPATRIAALLAGDVDFVQDVPVQDIARLEQTAGITITTGPENRNIFISYDQGSEELRTASVPGNPFANPLVREAMALALDREAIQQVVMRGQSQPSAAPLPPFVNGWTEEKHAFGPPDIERARELMAEAGYGDGFTVDFNCPNDRYLNDEAICTAFAGMLGRIGITATLVAQSRTLHFPLIHNRELDLYLLGWGVPTYDSQYVFDFLVHTTEGARGGWNGSNYSNPDADALIQAMATETDLEARDRMIADVWDMVIRDRVFLNIHNQVLAYAARDGIGVDVRPDNSPRMLEVRID